MTIFSDIKNLLLPAGKRSRLPVFNCSPCQPHGTGLKVRFGSFLAVLLIIAEKEEGNKELNRFQGDKDNIFKGKRIKAG
jgi:hypothetical protein